MPLVYLKDIITVEDLLKRWQRLVSEKRLASLLKRKSLVAYRLPSPPVPRKPGDTLDAYELWDKEPEHSNIMEFFEVPEGKIYYDFSGFVFNRADIVAYEVKHLEQDEPLSIVGEADEDKPATQTEQSQQKAKKQKRGHITQKQAAKMCGISLRKFSDLENGKIESLLEDKMPSRFKLHDFAEWAERYFRMLDVLDIETKARRKSTVHTVDMDMKVYSEHLYNRDK